MSKMDLISFGDASRMDVVIGLESELAANRNEQKGNNADMTA